MPRLGENLSLEPSLDEEDYDYDVDQEKDDFDEKTFDDVLSEKNYHNGEIEIKYEKEQEF
tara:strand:+ start:316 stop:495 length:180 start_codon:yes stop_codon:yes gene_type:complete